MPINDLNSTVFKIGIYLYICQDEDHLNRIEMKQTQIHTVRVGEPTLMTAEVAADPLTLHSCLMAFPLEFACY